MLVLNQAHGVPLPVLILLALLGVFSWITSQTVFGRHVYAVGGNVEASRLSGVNVKRVKLMVFMLMGLMCAFAGIVTTARAAAGSPSAGVGGELDAIAACFIGGTSMRGGSGTVYGALIGALVMASLDNGMQQMSVDTSWQMIVKGAVLVLAVWIDVATRSGVHKSQHSSAPGSCLLAVGTYTEILPHVQGRGLGIHLLEFDGNPPRSANARSQPARSILPTCAHGATGSTASANAAATRRWTSVPSRTAARLRPIGRAAVPGADPCHVSVNPVARQLYVSNYSSGELLCYALDDKGLPAGEPQALRRQGSGRAPTARTARTRISRCPMPPARMCTCATWAPTRSSAIACRPTASRRNPTGRCVRGPARGRAIWSWPAR